MKTFWLIRGVSGAGKSSVARELLESLPDCIGHEADDYRMVDGEYVYSAETNYHAHKSCNEAVELSIENGWHNIVVSNTSVHRKDVMKWKEFAESNGYKFVSLVVENYHETGNTHGTSEAELLKMENILKQNIKLK